MYTHTFLEQVKNGVFQPYFMEGILALQADRIATGEYSTQVRDYERGLSATLPTLNEEEKALFEEYERLYKMIREQYARHGFIAGIYAGFRHIFTPHHETDGGYDKYVMNELMLADNMPRNQTLYQAVLKKNEIYNVLAKGRVVDSYSPLVGIACYWDEMACSAGSLAFYMGYRAAHSITDRFGVMETNYEAKTSKLLMLEHAFGFIETVAEKDRRMERQANGTWDTDDEDIPRDNEDEE